MQLGLDFWILMIAAALLAAGVVWRYYPRQWQLRVYGLAAAAFILSNSPFALSETVVDVLRWGLLGSLALPGVLKAWPKLKISNSPLLWGILYSLWVMISAASSLRPTLSFMRGGSLLLMFVAAFATLPGGIKDGQAVKDYLRANLVISLLVISASIGLALLYPGLMIQGTRIEPGAFIRLNGIFNHPNTMGSFIALMMPALVATVLQGGSRAERLMAGTTLALGMLGLVWSLSRAAWLGALAVVIIFAAFSRSPKIILTVLVVSLLAAGILFLGSDLWRQDLADRVQGGLLSTRIDIWNYAVYLFRTAPLTGIGLGSTAYASQSGLKELYVDGILWDKRLESTYLEVVAETGVIGGLIFCGLVFTLLRDSVTLLGKRFRGLPRILRIGLFATIVSMLVLQAFGSAMIAAGNPLAIIFWATAGVIRKYVKIGAIET